jgi:tetratricopeptide (TPR) repeat protein
VAIYRKVAESHPGTHANIAAALFNLGINYDQLERLAEALQPTLEAVTVYRALAARDQSFQADLADALADLGFYYSEFIRSSEALQPITEAAQLYQRLTAGNPKIQVKPDHVLIHLINLNKALERQP